MEKHQNKYGHSKNPGYIAGDPWYRCDRCGFDYRKSNIRKQWDGLMVCTECWEPRHPQDFVKGVKDKQSVENPRPDIKTALSSTTLSAGASKGDKTIDVTTTTNIAKGDGIGIELDNGVVQWTFVSADVSGATVTLNDGLLGAAASGNDVSLSNDGSSHFLSTNEVSANDL